MSAVSVSLDTGRFGGNMHMPGVGTTYLEFDVVKGIQLPNTAPLIFTDYLLPNTGNNTHQLSLPEDTAKKIYDFSETTYVNGKGDFNCRAFLGYVMGWDTDIRIGADAHRAYYGNYIEPGDTRNGLPYLVSQGDRGVTPHAVLGIEKPGMSLSVAGHESPLIIADNADLLSAFGGFALLEVTRIEDA